MGWANVGCSYKCGQIGSTTQSITWAHHPSSHLVWHEQHVPVPYVDYGLFESVRAQGLLILSSSKPPTVFSSSSNPRMRLEQTARHMACLYEACFNEWLWYSDNHQVNLNSCCVVYLMTYSPLLQSLVKYNTVSSCSDRLLCTCTYAFRS